MEVAAMWSCWRVVMVLIGLILSLTSAAQDEGKIHLKTLASFARASLTLPKKMSFAQPGPEPNNPQGDILRLGGALTVALTKKTEASYEVAFSLVDGNLQNGFTDYRSWPPNADKTYPYSRVTRMDPIQTLKLAFGKPNPTERLSTSRRYGVGVSKIGLAVEQGFDRSGSRQPLRSVHGKGYGWLAFVNWDSPTTSISLEVGPISRLNFGSFGKAKYSEVNLTATFPFR